MNAMKLKALWGQLSYNQPYFSHAITVGLFAVAGVLFGLIRANSSAGLAPQVDKWSIPKTSAPAALEVNTEEIASRFWTEQARGPKKKAEPQIVKKVAPWNFVGTINQGGQVIAVIATEKNKILRLKVGDLLPGDEKIIEIAEGQFSFEREGGPQTLKLFVESKPK